MNSPRDRISYSANGPGSRSEEHTSELQSRPHLVCRLLLEKKKIARPCRSHTTCVHTWRPHPSSCLLNGQGTCSLSATCVIPPSFSMSAITTNLLTSILLI